MENPLDIKELDLEAVNASAESKALYERTQHIIAQSEDGPKGSPDVLLELLSIIIKPLFSGGHPQITPAGRKPAYTAPPTLPHAIPVSLHEEKQWKIPLTFPLLKMILKAYPLLPQSRRREVLEAQFSLLVPPILNIIDDMAATSKAEGYGLLRLLCDAILASDSDILKRTGLIDVFIDTIKTNFMLLPTLTPEDESLLVLQQLYPASLALIRARFEVIHPLKPANTSSKPSNQPSPPSSDSTQRQTYLTLLLRHGLLASLTHLSAGTSTSFLPLTTYLITQLSPIISALSLPSVTHLQTILPMLRNLLMDPFGPAAPSLLLATLDAMSTIISVCKPRIAMKWWPDCLRGLVGCWCNILDDEEAEGDRAKRKVVLIDVMKRLVQVTQQLSRVVDEKEWSDAKEKLIAESDDLKDLFAEGIS